MGGVMRRVKWLTPTNAAEETWLILRKPPARGPVVCADRMSRECDPSLLVSLVVLYLRMDVKRIKSDR